MKTIHSRLRTAHLAVVFAVLGSFGASAVPLDKTPQFPRDPQPLSSDVVESFIPQSFVEGDEGIPKAPATDSTIEGITFDQDGSLNGGFYHIPPDPHGAVGPNHVLLVVNSSIEWHTKAGVQEYSDNLSDFFTSLSPETATFDPKVIYDQQAGRWVVITLEKVDSGSAVSAGNKSWVFIAVSDDSDPNGTWTFHKENTKASIGGVDRWADYPGLAVDDKAIYITNNMFAFSGGGSGFARQDLWIVHKGEGSGGFYDGGAATVTRHDPPGATGTSGSTAMPANIFGSAPGSVGTWCVTYSGLTGGGSEFLRVIRVDDPLGTPTFSRQDLNMGNIDNTSAGMPDAPQLGTANTIETNDRRALNAVWRNNSLWVTFVVVPPSGTDASQPTAHWVEVDTTTIGSLSIGDQGNVGGEDIATGAYTFFPAICVDQNDNMAIGFSLAASTLYCGAYYTGRESTDTAGTTQPVVGYALGQDHYKRTFGGPRNRWGDYTAMTLDPSDEVTFWAFNQYAMTRGTTFGGEDGRWATRFGSFSFAPAGPTNTPTPTPTPSDTPTPTSTPTPTPPPQVCASVTAPDAGQTVWGNRVTVKAEPDSLIQDVMSVQFQYSVTTLDTWNNIGAADTAFPFYAHWDATATGAGTYDLRAVVTNTDSVVCGASPLITVTANSIGADVTESDNGGDHLKAVAVSMSANNQVWAGDEDSAHAVNVTIPNGAITANTNLNIEFKDAVDFPGTLDSYGNVDGYVDLTLDTGSLTGTATIRFEFPDSVNNADSYTIYSLDTSFTPDRWVPLTNRVLNDAENYIEADTDTFSSFALLEGINPSTTANAVSGWNIIGYPGFPHVNTPSGLFADDVGPVPSGNFLTYDEASGNFVSASSLTPGLGYILWSDTGSVTLDGFGSKEYTDPVTAPLARVNANPTFAGYHFASNPYTASLDWDTVYGDSANIDNTYWEWDGSSYQFFVAGGGGGSTLTGTIAEWTGFWVRALAGGGSLVINRPGGAKGSPAPANPAFSPVADNWRLQISAFAQNGPRDEFNYAGIAPPSSDGLDPFDVVELAPLVRGATLELSFPNPDGTGESRYTQDVRALGAETYAWDFRVSSSERDQQIQLTWPNLGPIPANWEFYLTPEGFEGPLRLRKTKFLELNLGESGARQFLLEAVRLDDSAPGPLNRADLRVDGILDELDLFALALHWRTGETRLTVPGDFITDRIVGDVDGSNFVDGADLVDFLILLVEE